MPLILTIGVLVPIQPANAIGCAQVKVMIKSISSDINFSNSKGAKRMVDAYETAFKNPKCLSAKDIAQMRVAARDLILECSKPNSVYKALFSKPVYETFCGGFKRLSKYIK